MEWRWDNTNEPGTSPLTRLVRKIFNAFKTGPFAQGAHSAKDSSTETHYTNSPLGIPIPFRKVKDNNKPPKKGGKNMKRMMKE